MDKAITTELTQLAAEINAEHSQCLQAMRASLDHALKVGQLLNAAKELVDHGDWLPWITDNCEFSERTARAYMRVFRNWPELSKTAATADLTISGALKLLESPSNGKRKLSHLATLPGGPFRVIYANPPWEYTNEFQDVYPHQYAPMNLNELCTFGDAVKQLTGKNATLFIWVTPPVFRDAHHVIKAWGFDYKTNFVWVKDQVDHEDDFIKNRHEFLFIGGKGKATPDAPKIKLFKSVQRLKSNGKNYEKPEKFREIIEILYPKGMRLELFMKKKIDNWLTWA